MSLVRPARECSTAQGLCSTAAQPLCIYSSPVYLFSLLSFLFSLHPLRSLLSPFSSTLPIFVSSLASRFVSTLSTRFNSSLRLLVSSLSFINVNMIPTFIGLKGTKLQVAVAFLAGMDFLLFGYDQGVTGGLLTLKSFTKYFPEIDTSSEHYHSLSPAKQSEVATRQGKSFGSLLIALADSASRYHRRGLQLGLSRWCHSHDLARELAGT